MSDPSALESIARRLAEDWNTSRHSNKGWPLFLESIQVGGLRGWNGELVEFRFPVVALAGENGSGKSTVLKVAAAAYRCKETPSGPVARTFYPDDFFPNTPWENVRGVVIRYRVRTGSDSDEYSLRKQTSRWRGMPERPERPVFFLDISRTQPIDTLIGYGKIAKAASFVGDEINLDEENRQLLARVMGKSYGNGRVIQQGGKSVGVLELNGRTYSNFHQGAGEDATTDLVALLQQVPRNSLIIIDEIESSLHPRAQRRLMTELLDTARKRRIQFILSTHSPYVLEQLPTEARIYIQNSRDEAREIVYGVTPEFALTLMDDIGHPELIIYCEDEESLIMIERLIAAENAELLRHIALVPVGPANTVKALGRVASENLLPRPGLAVLDGDQEPSTGCALLPGGAAPERVAFDSLDEGQWELVAQRLGVRLGDLLDAYDDAIRLPNAHAWTRRLAEHLGARMRVRRVWEDLVAVWAEEAIDPAKRRDFVSIISSHVHALSPTEDPDPV